jgi:hypothetical protein
MTAEELNIILHGRKNERIVCINPNTNEKFDLIDLHSVVIDFNGQRKTDYLLLTINSTTIL